MKLNDKGEMVKSTWIRYFRVCQYETLCLLGTNTFIFQCLKIITIQKDFRVSGLEKGNTLIFLQPTPTMSYDFFSDLPKFFFFYLNVKKWPNFAGTS